MAGLHWRQLAALRWLMPGQLRLLLEGLLLAVLQAARQGLQALLWSTWGWLEAQQRKTGLQPVLSWGLAALLEQGCWRKLLGRLGCWQKLQRLSSWR